MSITPQAIKDQEFQIKFRGYDAIEVKAYLELLAEEFFELHEAQSRQEEKYEELQEQNRELGDEKEKLIEDSREREQNSEASGREFQQKEDEIAALKARIEQLEAAAEAAGEETELKLKTWSERESDLQDEIENYKEQLESEKARGTELKSESERLRTEVELQERQIADLRTEDVQFKSTIIAAQKFADDLRTKAEDEALQLLEDARDEVEMFRREAEEQLAALPLEIAELKGQKKQVREELRTVLNSYLHQLDAAEESPDSGNGEDLSDLFQSITLTDDGTDYADNPEQLGKEDTPS